MSKKSKPQIREIDEKVWNELKIRTFNNIESLLKSARILLDHHNQLKNNKLFEHPYVAAGLYTYAVEEYGKLLILESYKPEKNKIRLEYNKLIDHCEKFQKAFDALPLPCQQIGGQTIFKTDKPKGTISGIPWKTMEIIKLMPIDFEARKIIFYSDLDKDDKVKSLPQVDVMSLAGAIYRFQKIIDKKRSSFSNKS